MFNVSAITLYYIFRSTPLFADTLARERLWQFNLPRAVAIALFSSCKNFKLLHCKTVFWSVSPNSAVHLIHIRGVRTADADIRGPGSADFLADADGPRIRQTNTFADADHPRI